MLLIIFDCDGTLVDSQHLICAAMGEAFAARAMAPPAREAVLEVIGLSLGEAIARLAEGAEGEEIDALGSAYRAAFIELRRQARHVEPLFPGAREAVEALALTDDVLLGIATGKSRRGVDNFLERFAFAPHFATVQTADDAPSKPHPAMIERAMAETGAAAGRTVMVGDTAHDMAMARAAGVRAIGAAWGYHSEAALKGAGAHDLARDFADLMRLLSADASPRDAAE